MTMPNNANAPVFSSVIDLPPGFRVPQKDLELEMRREEGIYDEPELIKLAAIAAERGLEISIPIKTWSTGVWNIGIYNGRDLMYCLWAVGASQPFLEGPLSVVRDYLSS